MLDLIIHNARIYDGTGASSYVADVAVNGGKIVQIGRKLPAAKRVVDADGLALAPGFIDSHSHADNSVFHEPRRHHVLRMGVTTEIAGQCGVTQAPFAPHMDPAIKRSVAGIASAGDFFFSRAEEEITAMHALNMGPNLSLFVGHAPIRASVMGVENRFASEEEIREMQKLLEESMQTGIQGYTTGLSYVPGIYSNSHELIELAKVVSANGGMYATHSRSESAGLFRSIQECIDIAREAGLPVHISHLKCVGKTFWPRCEEMLAMIDSANAQGLTVTMDAYPYTAVSTTTTSAIPPQFLSGSREAFAKALEDPAVVEAIRREIFEIDDPGWDNSALHVGLENFRIVGADRTPQFVGLSYAEAGRRMGISPFEAMIRLLHDNEGYVRDVRFAMCEENLEMILKHRLCSVGSDGLYFAGMQDRAHPRAFGTFPRYLGRYIRERGILSREEGIRRITGMPAKRFRLEGKGFILPGFDADLVLFDYDSIMDGATFDDQTIPNKGIHHVYMNGELILEDNEPTGIYKGTFLKRSKAIS